MSQFTQSMLTALAHIDDARLHMEKLSDMDRLWVFTQLSEGYCTHCGRRHPDFQECQCWNDE